MKVGILGYGNLGRGVEAAVKHNPDTELVAVFTRRDPATVKINSNAKIYSSKDLAAHKDDIDVLIICGGSATDLPKHIDFIRRDYSISYNKRKHCSHIWSNHPTSFCDSCNFYSFTGC